MPYTTTHSSFLLRKQLGWEIGCRGTMAKNVVGKIKQAGFELTIHQTLDPTKVIAIAKDSDAIICQYAPITKKVIQSMNRCKGIPIL